MVGDDNSSQKTNIYDVFINIYSGFKEIAIHIIESEKNTDVGKVNLLTVAGFLSVCVIISIGMCFNDNVKIPVPVYAFIFLGIISAMLASRASTNMKTDSLESSR
jgi:hypothetical protein